MAGAPPSRGSVTSRPSSRNCVWFHDGPEPPSFAGRALHRPPLSMRSLMTNGCAVSSSDQTVRPLGRLASHSEPRFVW